MKEQSLSLTSDGSNTVFSERFNAYYHSKFGAIQESAHIFINAGFKYAIQKSKTISILEIGFGTGLNLLLTYLETEHTELNILYETVEAYPISLAIAEQLNYVQELKRTDLKQQFISFHQSDWNQVIQVNDNFLYKKHLSKFENTNFDTHFNIVYYDAFAPEDQAELWTTEIFIHLSKYLERDAILVSYCAKGSFKRSLLSAGFEVERIPGPPGKREMIRATFKGILK